MPVEKLLTYTVWYSIAHLILYNNVIMLYFKLVLFIYKLGLVVNDKKKYIIIYLLHVSDLVEIKIYYSLLELYRIDPFSNGCVSAKLTSIVLASAHFSNLRIQELEST